MFKKTFALLVVGLALIGCDKTAGGIGYFDTVNAPVAIEEPEVLIPEVAEPEVAEPIRTVELAEFLEEAIAEADAEPEVEVVEIAEAEIEPVAPATISTDDGTLNLNITSQEQQKIERDKAAILLAAARAEYTIIEPGALPEIVAGVNIALYARETTNDVGERLYKRPLLRTRLSSVECGKFQTPDDAQRYFLANDGPARDPLNLDPDGDGFPCSWSPEFYRLLN